MNPALDGVRVVELAQWVFVPSSQALLADWGADVVKIEHPRTGDPARGLRTQGLGGAVGNVDLGIQQNNRGKRSVGLDIKTEGGMRMLMKLVEGADVFVTSLRTPALERLDLGVDALRAINPSLIYARGKGLGSRGEQADRPCYDASAYWARGGMAHIYSAPDAERPTAQRPGFGDHTSALSLAFGICAALFKRERTGEPSIVETSLLANAMWVLSSDVVYSQNPEYDPHVLHSKPPANPLTGSYATRDGRFVSLVMLQPDRAWPAFCQALGHPEWTHDPRYADMAARRENAVACIADLRAAFETATLAEWCERLADLDAAWAPVQSVREVRDDPQAVANGYLTHMELDGTGFEVVSNPTQLDETVPALTPAPEVGAHTEEVLLELGVGWDEIAALREEGAV